MQEVLLQILSIAYLCTGIIVVIGYWPTIKDLINKKPSASIGSYIIWVIAGGISVLYSVLILKDTFYRILTALNFLCIIL